MNHEDHEVIKKIRHYHDIPEDAHHLPSARERFWKASPEERKRDLAILDEAQKEGGDDLRKLAQIGRLYRTLKSDDDRMKKAGL